MVRLTVNGERREIGMAAERLLIDVLREDLALTGTKEGCGVGVCGSCSVIVEGDLMSACIVPAVRLDGASITTIEGVAAPDGSLSALQEAFIREGGFQCGICTSGQIVAATALLAASPDATDAEIRDWMTGNLCRCTGYEGIVRAISAAVRGARSQ